MERVAGKYVRHTKTNIYGGSTIAVVLVRTKHVFHSKYNYYYYSYCSNNETLHGVWIIDD